MRPNAMPQFPAAHAVLQDAIAARAFPALGWTPQKTLAVALLTNRTFPSGPEEAIPDGIQQARPRFHNAVVADLGLATSRH